MKLHVDKEADALYLRLTDTPIVESEEVSPGVVLDFDDQKQVVGIEMLHLSKRSSRLNLNELQFQTTDAGTAPASGAGRRKPRREQT